MPNILTDKTTKAVTPKENGRSADITAPNYIFSCLGGCRNSYCYTMRNGHAYNNVYIYTDEIHKKMTANCIDWVDRQQWPKIPYQTDPELYVIDIGCNTDVSLMWKYIDWKSIFREYEKHPKCKASFATKYPFLLTQRGFRPKIKRKTRVRVSLTTLKMSNIMEQNVENIVARINSINKLYDMGYEVHINFSPIIGYDGWIEDYIDVFKEIRSAVRQEVLETIKLECIMLTHNKQQHERNLAEGRDVIENHLWNPQNQERKESKYARGMENYRYNRVIKPLAVERFTKLLSTYLPECEIRYIF